MTSYRLVSLQRTLKIIGGFTRLALRDGKTQYLNHLPRCWGLVAQSLSHPDCAPLEPLLTPYLQQALQKAA
jgi:aminoglycoside/choline kinase family phosphotransferase